MSTDSEHVAAASVDHVLVAVVCLAGIAAWAVQWFLGRPSADLLALMVVAAVGLLYRLNMRLVVLLHRQRRRKTRGEGE